MAATGQDGPAHAGPFPWRLSKNREIGLDKCGVFASPSRDVDEAQGIPTASEHENEDRLRLGLQPEFAPRHKALPSPVCYQAPPHTGPPKGEFREPRFYKPHPADAETVIQESEAFSPAPESRAVGVRLTKAEKLRAIGAAQAGAGWWEIAQVCGMTMNIFRARVKSDPKFEHLLLAAREFATDLVEKRLFTKAMDGDTVAMIFYLKNKRPWFWRDRHEISTTNAPTVVQLKWSEPEAPKGRLAEVVAGRLMETYEDVQDAEVVNG